MLFRATIGFNTMKIIMLRRHPKDNNFFRYQRVGTSSDILSAQWNYSQVLLVSLPFQSPASQDYQSITFQPQSKEGTTPPSLSIFIQKRE